MQKSNCHNSPDQRGVITSVGSETKKTTEELTRHEYNTDGNYEVETTLGIFLRSSLEKMNLAQHMGAKLKGYICYIFASLFLSLKRKILLISLQKFFLFSRKSNFRI